MEGYANAGPLNGTAANAAPVTGGRRHRKMRKVSAKTIKRTLKHLGMKAKGRVVLKGGDADMEPAATGEAAPTAGRRRGKKTARKTRRGSRKYFGVF